MSTIKEYLTSDHRKCDELFAIMEHGVSESLTDAKDMVKEFISQTERKRRFNQKLFKIAHLILNEDNKIDDFLGSLTLKDIMQ